MRTAKEIDVKEPKTLGDYRDLWAALTGDEGSRAVKFLDARIVRNPKGRDDLVIADPRQMMVLLGSLIDQESDQ